MQTSSKPSIKKKVYKHSQRESFVQKKFLRKLRKDYPFAFIVKLSDKWVSGLPDVMMISDGMVFFYEIKASDGEVTEIQQYTHEAIRRAGASVEIVRGGEI